MIGSSAIILSAAGGSVSDANPHRIAGRSSRSCLTKYVLWLSCSQPLSRVRNNNGELKVLKVTGSKSGSSEYIIILKTSIGHLFIFRWPMELDYPYDVFG